MNRHIPVVNPLKGVRKNIVFDRIFFGIVMLLSFLIVIPLLVILYQITVNGISSVNWELVSSVPDALKASGGGIVNSIVGSLLIVAVASLIAIPIGILSGIYLSENNGRFASAARMAIDVLQGVPSIILGVVVYAWFMKHNSGLSGSVALAIMMLPVVIKNTEETLKMIPYNIKEAAYALGVPYYRIIMKIILPAGLSGIVTGILVSVARITGETAPLLFTAFGSPFLNANLLRPMDAVPLVINRAYNYPNMMNLVWGASFILVAFILVLNLIAKLVVNKWKIKF